MKRFEYMIEDEVSAGGFFPEPTKDRAAAVARFNELGALGWELVCVDSTGKYGLPRCYYRREIADAEPYRGEATSNGRES